MAIKHVGRLAKNQRKVVVAYRVIPNEPDSCIIVTTENLMADEHDALIKAVESDAGQSAYEFAECMARSRLPDGRIMLSAFHTTGKMLKVKQSDVEMTPDTTTVINLAELNKMIAEQKGVTVGDLAISDSEQKTKAQETADNQIVTETINLDTPAEVQQAAQAASNEVLTDEELAAKYRSDADRLYKEAKRLRDAAEELVPTKKKAKAKSEESA